MKKGPLLFAALMGIALFVTASAFSLKHLHMEGIYGVFIEVENSNVVQFVTAPALRNYLQKNHPELPQKRHEEINMSLLEESLEKHSAVENANVYSNIKGVLNIEVTQRVPILRFKSSKSNYYLDKNASKMPLSNVYTASVPLVTGKLGGLEKEACRLFSIIKADSVVKHWFTGLHIEAPQDWLLYSKVGVEKIYLGEPKKIKEKLAKLKLFYKKALSPAEINSIASINLKYQDQVICKRHPNN